MQSESSECQICYSPAVHRHYGVFSCNSCKMFFKRSSVLKLKWRCPFKNQCFDVDFKFTRRPRCKACRFQRCLSKGMYIDPRLIYKLDDRSNEVGKVIGQLIYNDTRRSNILMHQFTAEDLNLAEIVRQRGHVQFEMKRPNWRMSVQQWNVLYAFTTAEFFLSLDFMGSLEISDRVTLIQNFTFKASFSFLALRSMNERSDRLITPEGTDALPEALAILFGQSNSFCQQLRSLLVSKFIELKITKEELLLLNVVLFCSPAHPDLSESSRKILASHQKIYNNALLQTCLLSHQHAGPSRYADLLSLCQVIDKNHSNAQFATLMLTMLRPDLKLPRVVADSQL